MTSKGVEIRAQIDTELVKGLLVINGGGSIALLAFLPAILGKPEYAPLAKAVLWGLLSFQVGLVAAVIHNRLRRVCSLEFEGHNYSPPPCKAFPLSLLKLKTDPPCVCRASVLFMWASIISFLLAGILVINGGFCVLNKQVTNTTQENVISAPNKAPQPTANAPAELNRYGALS